MHWSLHSQQLRQPALHTYDGLFPGWCKWNSPYFPPMTPDVISMQQHVTGRELWFWTLPVFQVSGGVSCPAAPWPHLAPSICALSATFCHSAPTLATRFIFVKHGMKRADFSGKDPCPRWGGGAQACSSTLHVAIYIYLKASLRWAHIEYRNGRLSAIRSRQ